MAGRYPLLIKEPLVTLQRTMSSSSSSSLIPFLPVLSSRPLFKALRKPFFASPAVMASPFQYHPSLALGPAASTQLRSSPNLITWTVRCDCSM